MCIRDRYKSIVPPLDIKFDGKSTKVIPFLDDIQQKSIKQGWDTQLLQVNDKNPLNPQNWNLITHHRLVSLGNVRAHAVTYVGTPTRLAQDASMMYEFLCDSVTNEVRSSLTIK